MEEKTQSQEQVSDIQQHSNIPFAHLHLHTRYSVLDGACDIKLLMDRAVKVGMKAMAITDHGNMFGVMDFVNTARQKGIKPIVGCEFYVAENSRFNKQGKEDRSGYHLILLAKNELGYRNLCKLNSLSFKPEAFYYKPRIDHSLLEEYHEGIIAASACLAGEIPQAILSNQENKLHESISFFKNLFGDDFYFEMQNHGHEEQEIVNKRLAELSIQYGIKCIATNDVHFIYAEDKDPHKILICLNTGKKLTDETKLVYTGNEYLKTAEEMLQLFANNPEYVTNTWEIVEKVEDYSLEHDILLPKFSIPEGFSGEMEYLRHITYEGAIERYGKDYGDEVKERLQFELDTIEKMGFPGYFLIVWDFIKEAKRMGVLVGPGRGSAAGSVGAYCLGITSIDPLKYNLLFERFLNPGRISMPDIDVDFDDVGREKVIQYVIDKYGSDQVAQIITYGTMAAKSAIKDVARVLDLPLPESNRLAGLVPAEPGMTLPKAMATVAQLKEEMENNPNEIIRKTLKYAMRLEGSIRSTGTHACGMIIAPEDLTKYVPTSIAKDSNMPVTQYEGSYVESVGLLKMDFLGLKTLTIIKGTLDNIKLRHNIDVDIDNVSLDDEKTYALFGRGETNGVFQFESEGMKKYLKELQPSRLEDLIAMNALYRPGPMAYIPKYIDRKFGREPIEYELPGMEEFLEETYGITVYQEQVMLLSGKLANFSKADADTLRKAMGKKQKGVLDKMKSQFDEGCKANGLNVEVCSKVWKDWEAFASYAFNKSHSTCYAFLAYQTAYLKAHYPAEFMASVLTNNLNNIESISFYMDECKRMKIDLLGPDVNESQSTFTVNKGGAIRFGLSAIKNVGKNVVEDLIAERKQNGKYTDIVDFAKRSNLKSLNKRCIESLVKGGAFDSFYTPSRAAYFACKPGEDKTFIDKLFQYAIQYQQSLNSAQGSLFGEIDEEDTQMVLDVPMADPWGSLETAQKEKEVVGFYISGHPLDDYKIELEQFSNIRIDELKSRKAELEGRTLRFGVYVSQVYHGITKTGSAYGRFTVEDKNDSYEWAIFGEYYLKYKHLFEAGQFLFVQAIFKSQWKGSEDLKLCPTQVMLLKDAMDFYTKGIVIDIELKDINNDFTAKMNEKLQLHKVLRSGKSENNGASIVFRVQGPSEIKLNMPVQALKVVASTFVNDISQDENLRITLNK